MHSKVCCQTVLRRLGLRQAGFLNIPCSAYRSPPAHERLLVPTSVTAFAESNQIFELIVAEFASFGEVLHLTFARQNRAG
jgi:hypothetical protein